MESFIPLILLGGATLAISTAPLGCLMLWRKMAYFGESLAHSTLTGVALGLWWGFNPSLGLILGALAAESFYRGYALFGLSILSA